MYVKFLLAVSNTHCFRLYNHTIYFKCLGEGCSHFLVKSVNDDNTMSLKVVKIIKKLLAIVLYTCSVFRALFLLLSVLWCGVVWCNSHTTSRNASHLTLPHLLRSSHFLFVCHMSISSTSDLKVVALLRQHTKLKLKTSLKCEPSSVRKALNLLLLNPCLLSDLPYT
jgi:hypothetical protein